MGALSHEQKVKNWSYALQATRAKAVRRQECKNLVHGRPPQVRMALVPAPHPARRFPVELHHDLAAITPKPPRVARRPIAVVLPGLTNARVLCLVEVVHDLRSWWALRRPLRHCHQPLPDAPRVRRKVHVPAVPSAVGIYADGSSSAVILGVVGTPARPVAEHSVVVAGHVCTAGQAIGGTRAAKAGSKASRGSGGSGGVAISSRSGRSGGEQ